MSRIAKPWYRKDRKAWFVTIQGERHNLGPDRKKAFQTFHDLMRQPQKPIEQPNLLIVLIDRFLEWAETNRAPDTYLWYQSRLQLFATRYPNLRADCLKPFHVQQWIDSFRLSSGSKRNYARAITRCMNWCEEQGLIERSPLAHFKKPRGGKRDRVISADEYAKILLNIRNEDFRDLVMFIASCRLQQPNGDETMTCLPQQKLHETTNRNTASSFGPLNTLAYLRAPIIQHPASVPWSCLQGREYCAAIREKRVLRDIRQTRNRSDSAKSGQSLQNAIQPLASPPEKQLSPQ